MEPLPLQWYRKTWVAILCAAVLGKIQAKRSLIATFTISLACTCITSSMMNLRRSCATPPNEYSLSSAHASLDGLHIHRIHSNVIAV